MTKTNNKITIVGGVKFDGKTTLAYYLSKLLNQPTIIIDVAKEFKATKPYQVIVNGTFMLDFILGNTYRSNMFHNGKMELIFRPTKEDYIKEVEQAFRIIALEENILLFCDEMELYADRYLTKKSPIYQMFYKSRNQNINIICVIKEIKSLSNMIRSAGDYYLLGRIRDKNARAYFSERGTDEETTIKHFDSNIKGLRSHEFLLTDFDKLYQKIKLNKQIIKQL